MNGDDRGRTNDDSPVTINEAESQRAEDVEMHFCHATSLLDEEGGVDHERRAGGALSQDAVGLAAHQHDRS